jgi:hypothetical protein
MDGRSQQDVRRQGTGVGKTKRVTAGHEDARNDIMLYAIVDAESHDAPQSIESHPHLQIPQASIEVMEINPLPGM